LYVYSSGSVEAQRVLFANSVHGDLSPLFSGNFDTTVGGKREAASYRVIADVIGLDARDVVFLSDVDAELDAARAAGMQTVRLLRPADTPDGATTAHASAVSFDELQILPA
jgi:enolase-phosphatase E1